MRLTPQQFETLCKTIVQSFSEEGLKQLLRTKLGTFWEKVIPKDNKSFQDKVHFLIDMFEESETTSDLIQAILTARPHQKSIQDPLSDILASLHAEATTVREQIEKVNKGVQKVKEGMSRKEVSALVRQLEGALSKLEKNIQLLRTYKGFHDSLHFVQFELRRFSGAVRNLHLDPMAATVLKESVDLLLFQALHVEGSLNELPPTPKYVREVEREWILRLRTAAENVRNPILGREAAQDIRMIVRQEPARIDLILRMTADSLELDLLKDLFSRVANVPSLPSHVSTAVREGQPATERLLRQVQALVSQHGQWQQIDLKSWIADDVLPKSSASDPSDFDASWGGIKRLILALIDSDPASQWATVLTHDLTGVDGCRKDGDFDTLRRSFDEFRYQAVRQFFTVDATLKILVGEIGEIGSSVRDLLGEL
jgi:hypothetical protein